MGECERVGELLQLPVQARVPHNAPTVPPKPCDWCSQPAGRAHMEQLTIICRMASGVAMVAIAHVAVAALADHTRVGL